MRKNKTEVGMRVLACVAATLILFGCGKAETNAGAPPGPAPMAEAVTQAPPPPPPPTHFYVLEEDGEYGYEKGLSEDERRAGKAAGALLMVRYLGVKDGTHTVAMPAGGATATFSCKPPCDFIKSKVVINGQVVKSETVRNTGEAVISAVMADAMSGQLKPYKPRKS